MVRLLNYGLYEFKKLVLSKEIFVFGAGRALNNCLESVLDKKDICKIIDGSEEKQGKVIVHRGKDVPIISVNEFVDIYKAKSKTDNCLMLINSAVYADDIVALLDSIPELEGLNCCIQSLIINKIEPILPYDFSHGPQIIPKTIHYIWFGEKALPEEFVQNINSWKKHNQEYEVICWNETNYDISKSKYMRDAYAMKDWAFVSNYARLDVLYEYGGIYLDTDVEVLRSLDCLLCDEAFFNMGRPDRVNLGCGLGAKKGNSIIAEMMEEYEKRGFANYYGKPNPAHSCIHNVLRRRGFYITNQYQKINGVVLYPNEVMSPLTIEGMDDYCTEKTRSIHKEKGSWRSEKEKEGLNRLKKLVQKRL